MFTIPAVVNTMILAPLFGAVCAGFLGQSLGRRASHTLTIAGVGVAMLCAFFLAYQFFVLGHAPLNYNAYTWIASGIFNFHVGFLIDGLTVVMTLVVTFISFLVHVYTIGYMHDDPGYQRFFSYISLFTFAMLMLVTANNFLQLFFGWEGVGVVSYLLIGFWFHKESAIQGSLKAFLVNRVGDFGFILGIGAILALMGSLDYATVFARAGLVAQKTWLLCPDFSVSALSLICFLLFIGAMGKSAQIPLHVWLPESMEGPTPISALIHAATMVTAGIFMIARLSPLFELSPTVLNIILCVGASSAFFMGLLGIVQNDIKRVVAYSTLSQLGYMIAAEGASAYYASIFHLASHAFFKALLFLAAGSVIMAMHHEQDMRRMGGLYRYLPITYGTFAIGSLALCGIPPFSGFFSKDLLIEAIQRSTLPGAHYAYYCVLFGVFVTAFYTFRSFFMTFHGAPRMEQHTRAHLHESPWVVCVPLIVLAIPSMIFGACRVENFVFSQPRWLDPAITVLPAHDVMRVLAEEFHGPWAMVLHAPHTLPFWLALAGIASAYVLYCRAPALPRLFAKVLAPFYFVLLNKYGFDAWNDWFFVRGGRALGHLCSRVFDGWIIDSGIVLGTAHTIAALGRRIRCLQTGFLYHYASFMLFGVLSLLAILGFVLL